VVASAESSTTRYVGWDKSGCDTDSSPSAWYCGDLYGGPVLPYTANAGDTLYVGCAPSRIPFDDVSATIEDGSAGEREINGNFATLFLTFPDGSTRAAATTTVSGSGTAEYMVCVAT
jgi:hypothetical protein